ncbi:hypothetical protein BH09PLA1_BH09PLA1_06050 [soil metagenome]
MDRISARRQSARGQRAASRLHRAVIEVVEPRLMLSVLPSGFVETEHLSGLASPTSMAVAPDGRVFVAQQNGIIRLIKNDLAVAQPVASITVDSSGERGLVGIGLDPDFATNKYLYAYYTATTPVSHNRLSRFTLSGDVVALNSEQILFDLPSVGSGIWHMGGGVHFGADGKLYVGVGDQQDPLASQSLDSPFGKILRLNPDGTIPTDNPFYSSTVGINKAIWAYGLRNPYTSAFQPGTGLYYINDVGQETWEEINQGVAGSNYGWPNTEGATSLPQYRGPIYAYTHGPECAITGGDFYNPATTQFPPQYVEKYFFMDFCAGWIKTFDPVTKQVGNFATGTNFPNDMRVASDGSMYYLSRGQPTGGQPATGKVYKIRYTASVSPWISTQPAPQTVAAGETAAFTVVASGPSPLSYQWLRNDIEIPGATSATYSLTAIAADGGASFKVRVSNSSGNITSMVAGLRVVAGNRPTATFNLPLPGTLYRAGDTIQYSATATDIEDGNLPASSYVWQVDLHHATHSHPFIAPTAGSTGGSFIVPNTGESSPDVFYRVHLTVTDQSGLTYSTFRDVSPRKANITLATNVPGLTLSLDGQPRTLPFTVLGVAGMTRLLSAPLQQTIGQTVYTFSGWSDGGAATHNIAFPLSDTTYTATYSAAAPTYLSSFGPTTAINGWGPYERDRSNGEQAATDGRTITLNGVTFTKGLGVHAASDLRYNLAGGYGRFQAQVGVDDEVGSQGSVIFQVFADGTKIFDSGVMTGASTTKSIDVDVTGKNILQLVVDPNGVNSYDHADWADAKLLAPGAPPPPPPPPPSGLFYPPVGFGTDTHAHGVTTADFNGDGKLDLAVANAGGNSLSVLFGNGDGTFGAATNYPVGSEPKSAFAKDLNNDGKLDLITANQGSATISVLINNGNGTFAPAVSYASPSGSHEAFAADFNGDGKADIAVVGWGSNIMRVLINSGSGTFPTGANYTVGNAPHSVIGADLDNDGDIDLAIANRDSNSVAILKNTGNGTFAASVFVNVGSGPHSIRAADLNGDGKIDLVTANEGGDSVSVLINTGNATFATAVILAAGSVPKGVAIADVNNDTKLDILVADSGGNYPSGDNAAGKKIAVLLGNGDGTFAAASFYDAGHTPFSVTTGDFDGDGDLDVVTANWHSNDITVLKNTTIDTAPPPPTNNPPVANDDSASTQSGAAVLVNVLANDTDSDGTLIASSVAISTAPANGTTTVDTITGRITYTPGASFVGTDTFYYTVKDNGGATSNPAKVTVTVGAPPPPPPPPGTIVFLSDLTPTSATNGWGPYERDRSNGEQGATDGRTLTLNGVTFAKGLGVHAASDIRYALAGQYTRFDSVIGVDDESGNSGSVIFRVYLDNVLVFDSGVMGGASANQVVSLDLAGRSALRLVVDTNCAADWDHADWADAKLTKGTPVPDTQAPSTPTNLRTTSITANSIALAWDASTDNVGVAGYEIYRDGVKVGTSTTATYNDSVGLTANTTYTYTVRAYDAVPNYSTLSAAISPKTLAPGALVYLSDLNPVSATNGWGNYERDRSNGETGANDGRTITLNGVTYAKGLGVHANSDIVYNLNGQYANFQAAIGVDDEVGNEGNVIFRVYVDGVLIYDSGAMTGASATKLLSLNVAGKSQLRLVVDSNGTNNSDHADWADAKLT